MPPARYATRFVRARCRSRRRSTSATSPTSRRSSPDRPIDERTQEKIDRGYRCGLAALLSVDDAVAAIVAELRRSGRLDSTTIVLTADQGVLAGEHRLRGKNLPYEEAIGVPLLVRSPGVTPGRVVAGPVVNADLAPTILELAGATCPGRARADDRRRLAARGDAGRRVLRRAGDPARGPQGGASGAPRPQGPLLRRRADRPLHLRRAPARASHEPRRGHRARRSGPGGRPTSSSTTSRSTRTSSKAAIATPPTPRPVGRSPACSTGSSTARAPPARSAARCRARRRRSAPLPSRLWPVWSPNEHDDTDHGRARRLSRSASPGSRPGRRRGRSGPSRRRGRRTSS